MINFLNRDKSQIKLYAVIKREAPDKFLTVTTKKDEAVEYALKLLKLEHLSHFQSWCILRNYSSNCPESWDIYFNDCISEAEKHDYIISKISYKLKDLAGIIRMFGGCVPLGCSYDLPVEYEYSKAKSEFASFEAEFREYHKEHQERLDGK